MPQGAAHHFDDTNDTANLNADNLNGLDCGANVYEPATGGLFVNVTALRYWRRDANGRWVETSYAGATAQAVAASSTNYVYLDASGALVINATGFPSAEHLPLATVVTDGTGIITDGITARRPRRGRPSPRESRDRWTAASPCASRWSRN